MIGWLALFAGCGLVLTVATLALIRAVDVISDKTGLGRAFLGMILVATVTSLPEMATGITSVAFIDAPDIAVGDVVGSCVINLMLFALADAASGKVAFYGNLKTSHSVSAAFSIVLLSVLAFALARPETSNFAVGHVSGYSIMLGLLYLCAAGMLYRVERKEAGRNERTQSEQRSLRAAIIQCAVAALFVALAGGLLAFSADKIAEASGLSASFVGVLFVAATTSLPEVIALLAAVRLKSYDLAAGNLLGSNLFNMVVLVADDIAYTRGPLFDATSPTLAIVAIVMTVIFIVSRSAIRRPEARSADAWIGGALVLMFAVKAGSASRAWTVIRPRTRPLSLGDAVSRPISRQHIQPCPWHRRNHRPRSLLRALRSDCNRPGDAENRGGLLPVLETRSHQNAFEAVIPFVTGVLVNA